MRAVRRGNACTLSTVLMRSQLGGAMCNFRHTAGFLLNMAAAETKSLKHFRNLESFCKPSVRMIWSAEAISLALVFSVSAAAQTPMGDGGGPPEPTYSVVS